MHIKPRRPQCTLAANSLEVRFDAAEADKEFLDGWAMASGIPRSTIMQDILHRAVEAKRHEYTVATRLRLGNGTAPETRGKP